MMNWRTSFTNNRSDALFDLTNFAVAGLRDGMGPLLTVYLISRTSWDPKQISVLLAAPAVASLLLQVPIGLLYDRLRKKQFLFALGCVIMGVAALTLKLLPSYGLVFVMQIATGLAMSLIAVGLPAISAQNFGQNLGQKFDGAGLTGRLARNETFNKLGNLAALGCTGYLAQVSSLDWICLSTVGLSIAACAAVLGLKSDASVVTRRNAPSRHDEGELSIFQHPLRSKPLLRILAFGFVFQLCNAGLFTTFEQTFIRSQKMGGVGIVASSMILTQIVIVFGTLALARRLSRGPSDANPIRWLGLGFALISLRALLFSFGAGAMWLAPAQVLDGLIASILIIVPIRAIAKMVPRGFNFASSLFGVAVSLGASLSLLLSGSLLSHFAASTVFAGVSLIAGLSSFLACGIAVSAGVTSELRPLSPAKAAVEEFVDSQRTSLCS